MIATIVPNNYFMPFDAVKCWISLGLETNDFYSYSGSTLYHNRNMVFNEARKRNEHLVFIDSDIIFKPEQVGKMVYYLDTHKEEGIDIITGVYTLFDTNDFPALFRRVADEYVPMKPEDGVNSIGACGMGFCAISKRVIQVIGDEPFNPFQEGKIQHGEDVSFCHRANLLGFKVWCDSSLNVGQVRIHHSYYGKENVISSFRYD